MGGPIRRSASQPLIDTNCYFILLETRSVSVSVNDSIIGVIQWSQRSTCHARKHVCPAPADLHREIPTVHCAAVEAP